MICLKNQRLDKYTTIGIGGIAERILVPESIEEIIEIIRKENPKYFIGGGSNLLIADRNFDLVIDLRSFNTSFQTDSEGLFSVGASVRLQHMINEINKTGYGGMEYLYSVPGLLGGAVAMNAGRGKKYRQSISDFIQKVDVIREGKLLALKKDDCSFSYRDSVFKNSKDIIVGCTLKMFPMSVEESSKIKKDRIEYCKRFQDSSKPNFGTVFCESNRYIMSFVQKQRTGGKVHFSEKTINWLINEGGNYKDAISAIKRVELYHKFLFQKCKREVVVWD